MTRAMVQARIVTAEERQARHAMQARHDAARRCCVHPPRLRRARLRGLLLCGVLLGLPSSSAACVTSADRPVAQESKTLAASDPSGAVTLGAGAVSVPLSTVRDPDEPIAVGPPPPIGDRLRRASSARQVYLQLQSLSAQDAPGVSYNVYLNLPAGQTPQGADDPHFAGAMSFFNAESGRGGDVALNITAALKRLLERGAIANDLRVTIVPAGEPNPAARPRIGKILLTAK